MWTDRESFEKIAAGHSEASLFHELAAPVFSGLRLRLANNPYERSGRYGYCSARYELSCGLSLCVGIETLDSNALIVTFGRKWFFNGQFAALSNYYYVFARQVHIGLPEFYQMGFQEQVIKPFTAAIKDIERSWATVIDGLSESAIEQAERSRFGACQILEGRRQLDPAGIVTVEDVDVTKKS